MVSEYGFGNGVLVIQKKNGREEKIRSGKEMMFEYAKILIDKYTVKSRQIFLLDTYLAGIKYIRNFNIKMRYAKLLFITVSLVVQSYYIFIKKHQIVTENSFNSLVIRKL